MGLADKFEELRRSLAQELSVYQLVAKDKRTPWTARALLGCAVGYLLLPFDLIPDFLPIIGHLDDVIIVPALIWLALKLIPQEVIDDARRRIVETEVSPKV